ncbi:MAG: alpha/beta hydrolase [Thermoanaerobaculia bacterium]|nr:alpha/beta hydrolase [Thermoanaerobaculia bacterium]
MTSTPSPELQALLAELEAAVRSGNRARARVLARELLERLDPEIAEHERLRARVVALLVELEDPPRSLEAPGKGLEVPLDRGTRGGGEPDGVVYPVWFGTNRTPDGAGGFGAERSRETTLGRALVFVPEAHRFGETGSSFWRRLLRFDLRDDRLRLQRVDRRTRAEFYAELGEVMASGGRQALVYLHGFKNTFEDAAIRAAQIGFDLAVPGATAFFSWPSKGTLAGYPADEATIEASESAIADFLVDFVAHCGAEKVHLVAHSMGNRGLLRALQRIAANAETRSAVRFGQIFLAAPDVDRDVFLDLAAIYPQFSERTTLYASGADLAVRFSGRIHAAPRAGYFEPYTVVPGIDTVAVPDFDVDALGHGYFAQAEALLHDLYDLMRHSQAPPRQRMVEVMLDGQSFWRLRR